MNILGLRGIKVPLGPCSPFKPITREIKMNKILFLLILLVSISGCRTYHFMQPVPGLQNHVYISVYKSIGGGNVYLCKVEPNGKLTYVGSVAPEFLMGAQAEARKQAIARQNAAKREEEPGFDE